MTIYLASHTHLAAHLQADSLPDPAEWTILRWRERAASRQDLSELQGTEKLDYIDIIAWQPLFLLGFARKFGLLPLLQFKGNLKLHVYFKRSLMSKAALVK